MMITAAAAKRLTAPIVSSTLEAVLAIEVSASDLPAPSASPEMTVMTAAMSAIRERRMVDFPFVGVRGRGPTAGPSSGRTSFWYLPHVADRTVVSSRWRRFPIVGHVDDVRMTNDSTPRVDDIWLARR